MKYITCTLLLFVLALSFGCATAPIDTSKVYELREVSKIPTTAHAVPPDYPKDLQLAGVSGEALVEVVVDENGSVTKVQIVSADNPKFGEAAAAAVMRWKLLPATIKGVPVKCRLRIPFKFATDK